MVDLETGMKRGTDRGVVELLQFLLLLSIMLVVVFGGVIFGISQLQGLGDADKVEHAKTEFEGVQSDMNKLANGVPHTASDVGLIDQTLRFGEKDDTFIQIDGVAGTESLSMQYRTTPIMIEQDGKQVILDSGAVFYRDQTGGRLVVSAPPLIISDERSQLVLYDIASAGDQTQTSGSDLTAGLIQQRVGQNSGSLHYVTSSGPATADVTIRVVSPLVREWRDYFEQHDRITVTNYDPATSTVEGKFETDELVVRVLEVEAVIRSDG